MITYVDGRDLRSSVNALRYAYNKNPKHEKLKEFFVTQAWVSP